MTKQYSNAASLSGKDLVGLPLVSRSCRVKILQKKKKKNHISLYPLILYSIKFMTLMKQSENLKRCGRNKA